MEPDITPLWEVLIDHGTHQQAYIIDSKLEEFAIQQLFIDVIVSGCRIMSINPFDGHKIEGNALYREGYRIIGFDDDGRIVFGKGDVLYHLHTSDDSDWPENAWKRLAELNNT